MRGTLKDLDGDFKINEPLAFGDVIATPGDLVLGDGDGVVVIPQAMVASAVAASLKREAGQVIRAIGAEGLDRRGPVGSCRLFLGPGFRLAARWNRLVETVKTRKKREKTGKKWARYSLKRVKVGS